MIVIPRSNRKRKSRSDMTCRLRSMTNGFSIKRNDAMMPVHIPKNFVPIARIMKASANAKRICRNVTARYDPLKNSMSAINAGYPGERKYSNDSPGSAKCPCRSELASATYSPESPPVEIMSSFEAGETESCPGLLYAVAKICPLANQSPR
jgi:hypothetical protein